MIGGIDLSTAATVAVALLGTAGLIITARTSKPGERETAHIERLEAHIDDLAGQLAVVQAEVRTMRAHMRVRDDYIGALRHQVTSLGDMPLPWPDELN